MMYAAEALRAPTRSYALLRGRGDEHRLRGRERQRRAPQRLRAAAAAARVSNLQRHRRRRLLREAASGPRPRLRGT